MIRWLGENWRTFVWALILAVSVWIAAVTAADPDEERIYNHPISIEIVGQDPGLVILGDIPRSVEVTLRAPRSVWNRLDTQETPIRAVVDLSGLSAGEHTVSVQVQVAERPVRIVSVSPSSFAVNLEPLESRTFPINISLTGTPAVGYRAGNPVITPQSVVVSGAKSVVDQVTRTRVVVNLSGTRESINQTANIQVLDANSQPVKGLSVNPASVQVSLPVSQQGGYRDVAVKVVIHGQVANGYLLTKLSVFPPIVTVYSTDPTLVNNLPGIVETQPLELRGASEDITTRLSLVLPEGISVVGDQNVQVQVGIDPIQSNLTLSKVKVEMTGLTDSMTAQVSPAEVDVILSGPAPLLDTLQLQDIHVIVDLTGLTPGTYQLTPKVEILVSDVIVESVLPNTVEVVIAPAGTPTAAP